MRIDIGQISFIDDKLNNLLTWLEISTGMEFTITSLYRLEGTGVHCTLPLRGVDLRCRNEALGLEIQDLINRHYIYDSERTEKNCALLHGSGNNLHLHVQVHRNTHTL